MEPKGEIVHLQKRFLIKWGYINQDECLERGSGID